VLVATGYTHTLVASLDGGLWACGSNAHGQLGEAFRMQGLWAGVSSVRPWGRCAGGCFWVEGWVVRGEG